MTRSHWTAALTACVPLLVACPPTYSPGDSDTDTAGTDTTTSGSTGSMTTGQTTGTGTTSQEPTTAAMTTTEAMTTGTVTTDPTTGVTGCSDNDDCSADPDKPFCVDAECVSCDDTPDPDAACAGVDAGKPVCHLASGTCVECTPESDALCTGSTPVCDAATHECVGCSEHADCPESACNLESGSCFPAENVLWVDFAADCNVADGSMAAPYCQIDHALSHVGMNDPGAGWTIKVKTGNYIQPALVVPDGSVLAIVGEGGVAKIRSTSAATLHTGADSKITLSRLNLSSNAEQPALVCTSSDVWATDVTLANNREGYNAVECSAEFVRTVFYRNTSGGLQAFGAGATKLVNSYVSNNGSNAESYYGGILTGQTHELTLVYTSVIKNLSEIGARSLQCDESAGPTTVRNSVIIADGSPSIECATLTVEYSAIDDGDLEDDTNIPAQTSDVMTWFEPQIGGVYRAKPDTPIATVAVWKTGDPATDYNGDPRPQNDGASDYAGADRPKP